MIDESTYTITSETANKYAEQFSSPEDNVLAALNMQTQAEVHGAHMISGHLQGQFLKMISCMIQPKYVLELGTYTGYATIVLAAGLQNNGEIHTIDIDTKLQNIRDKYWQAAGLTNNIKQFIGKAIDLLPSLEYDYDLAFIDADKGNSQNYVNLLIQKMRKGSFILVDNTLFHGEVLKPEEEQNKTGKKIHDFNQYLTTLPNIEFVLLPIRDGITLLRII